MRSLDRKLLRDLLGMWGQALAISLVMACGVAMFVAMLCTHESLQETGVAPDYTSEIMQLLENTRDQVLGR